MTSTSEQTKRIRIDRILLPPNLPAGMNPLVVMSLALHYRSTTDDVEPIVVRREGRNYRIVDGRHRYIASVIAGRRRVLAQLDTPDPEPEKTFVWTYGCGCMLVLPHPEAPEGDWCQTHPESSIWNKREQTNA